MLNTPQQKAHLYGLLGIIYAYEAASPFPDNGTSLVSLEQQYRDELQILLNSLACGPGFDPVANRDGVGCNHEWTQYDEDSDVCAKCGAYSPF